jgi:hypothetical protein
MAASARTRVHAAAAVAVASVLVLVGFARVGAARAAVAADGAPEFTVATSSVVVGSLAGYGGQLNQHVYAGISGPPPDLPGLEGKVLALEPQFVRVFFNTTEWTYPDRMASFERAVELAQRAHAQIDVTWQGSTYAFAVANMDRFADVLADLLTTHEIETLWVTMFNEPNSSKLTLAQYEHVYRLLDAALRERGVRDRVRFMGGDLVATDQAEWFEYMSSRMGDLLDAWSIHVFWDFWDTQKIESRLAGVRQIFSRLPEQERRPLYVAEFGVRGLRSFDGERSFEPGQWLDGTPMPQTEVAAFQEAWFVVRAAQLGYVAASKWDFYDAKYDNGTQDYSMIGPGSEGWPLRPTYHLMRLLTLVARPTWSIVEVSRAPGADPAKLVAAYASPGGNVSVVGLDTDGGQLNGEIGRTVSYSIGGLPPQTLFRLVFWNGDGSGTNAEIGFLDSGPAGQVQFATPLGSVFALTNAPIASVG